MPSGSTIELTLGHSPDADDAFMWWPLGGYPVGQGGDQGVTRPRIDTEGFRFTPVALDIEELNHRAAERGDLDITAVSMHCFAHVAGRYALTSCGWSMGDGYGPKVVAREARPASWLASGEAGPILIPGERTSAYLALRLMIGRPFAHRGMRFDRIIDAVASGEAEAGVIIHDGQISYRDAGLELVADLGAWWTERTGLPLPLGANAIRRDLDDRFGPGVSRRAVGVLERSIRHAMAHRAEGLDFAMGYAPGADRATVDRFVAMYVNDLTLDAGERGEQGVRRFLEAGAREGFCPAPERLEIVRPSKPAV